MPEDTPPTLSESLLQAAADPWQWAGLAAAVAVIGGTVYALGSPWGRRLLLRLAEFARDPDTAWMARLCVGLLIVGLFQVRSGPTHWVLCVAVAVYALLFALLYLALLETYETRPNHDPGDGADLPAHQPVVGDGGHPGPGLLPGALGPQPGGPEDHPGAGGGGGEDAGRDPRAATPGAQAG